MNARQMIHSRIVPWLLVTGAFPVATASAQDFLLAAGSSDGGFSPAPSQVPLNLGTFDIVINPGSGLSSNTAALAAFNRAAQQWEAYISDSITVTIAADLGSLGAGIIGSTSSVILQGGYNTIRNQVVADASNESDDLVASFLPTAAQFSATLLSGSSLTGNLSGTKANLKALGFSGLDTSFGATDSTITFSNTFAFDFDNSDGVGAGLLDFETVAAHEIGHALGFFSAVDSADGGATSITPSVLDLFRFQNGTASDPTTTSEFTLDPRDLVPGHAAIFDDLSNEYLMSTGLTQGDARQASHWKDDALTSSNIGIMDPTLASGVFFVVGAADLRALDLIGYEIVPEVSALVFAALSGAFLLSRRVRG
ncbi:MAG: NF038122 family metalloprotease [Luteolibacter sp.]